MDYKIYYNDSFIELTSKQAQMNKKNVTLITDQAEVAAFFTNPHILFDGLTNCNMMFVTDRGEEIMQRMKITSNLVVAGGGMVSNETKELLLIHRKGKWDLPKGKIEKYEKITDGAVREVEEETGVKIAKVNPQPVITHHTYRLKGKDCIKETHWFWMKAKSAQNKLRPQTEEGIDEVRWVNKQDIVMLKEGCYPLVWDLLKEWVEE